MRHVEDASREGLDDLEDLRLECDLEALIQRRERLIEHQQVGVGREHPRQCHTLLLTTGELMRVPVIESAESEQIEQLSDPALALLLVCAALHS